MIFCSGGYYDKNLQYTPWGYLNQEEILFSMEYFIGLKFSPFRSGSGLSKFSMRTHDPCLKLAVIVSLRLESK